MPIYLGVPRGDCIGLYRTVKYGIFSPTHGVYHGSPRPEVAKRSQTVYNGIVVFYVRTVHGLTVHGGMSSPDGCR